MPIFEAFTTISVPFPYVEQPTLKRRPALVVSVPLLMLEHGLAWVLMITSAANAPWPSQVRMTLRGLLTPLDPDHGRGG